jgi:zinc protease
MPIMKSETGKAQHKSARTPTFASCLLPFASCLLPVAFCLALVSPVPAAGPPTQRRTLENGTVLIVSEQHALPMVVIQILIDAGSRRDPPGKDGLANLTADLLTEGTSSRSASQINETTDFIGASLDTAADTDYATLSLTVLSAQLDTGLKLLTDIMLHPTFPEAEVARRREAALATIKENEDDPSAVAQRVFVASLFRGEPYGHLVIGTERAVQQLTRTDVVSFYRQYYHSERSILTVVGDVSAVDIADRLQGALQSWSRGQTPSFEYPTLPSPGSETVTVDKPITQASIILGQRGIARDNPDYYALTVMNFILGGGGFTSRLLDNIRTKGGLAYSVASMFTVNKAPGSFQVVMQTKNASANDAIQRTCGEIERIRREPVTGEELAGAKLYLTGSFPLRLDTLSKIAGFLTQVEFYHLGMDYADTYPQRINAVTADDVRRVARQYLHPQQMDLVVVADLAQAKVPSSTPCPVSE